MAKAFEKFLPAIISTLYVGMKPSSMVTFFISAFVGTTESPFETREPIASSKRPVGTREDRATDTMLRSASNSVLNDSNRSFSPEAEILTI